MRRAEPFRQEPEQLLSHIEHIQQSARDVPHLDRRQRGLRVGQIVESFLRGTLVPHATAKEQVLYPAWEKLVGFADAAAPMVHDHQAIAERVERLERTTPTM